MIVHHARRLHERVADSRPDEAHAAIAQRPTHRVGPGGFRGNILRRDRLVDDRGAIHKRPEIDAKRAVLLDDRQRRLRVADCGRDLGAVAHDRSFAWRRRGGLPEKALDVALRHARHALDGEAVERLSIGVALSQDGRPVEPRLSALEREKLEERPIVACLDPPLLVVVGDQPGRLGPPTTNILLRRVLFHCVSIPASAGEERRLRAGLPASGPKPYCNAMCFAYTPLADNEVLNVRRCDRVSLPLLYIALPERERTESQLMPITPAPAPISTMRHVAKSATSTPLSDIPAGSHVQLAGSDLDQPTTNALQAMGLRPDESVVVCKSGEPTIVQLDGAMGRKIGLAQRVAHSIIVNIAT